jgi:DnaJ family protein A protein 5
MIEENEELDLETYEEPEESPQEESTVTVAEETAVEEPAKDVDTAPVELPDTSQTPSEASSESKSTRKKQKARKDSGSQLLQEAMRTKLSKTEMLARQREEAMSATFDLNDLDSASLGRPKSKGNKKGKSLNGQSGTATPLSTEPVNVQEDQADQSMKSEPEVTGSIDMSSIATPNGNLKSKRDRRREKEAAKTSKQAGPSTTLVCSFKPILTQSYAVQLQRCNVCQSGFGSRTKLFDHIKSTGHASAGDDNQGAQKTSRGSKKR